MKQGSGRSALGVVLGLAFSGLFLWLAARGVDWSTARDLLGQIGWSWIIAYVAAVCGIQALRMIRWSVLLHSLGEQRFRLTLPIGAVGLSAIFFLPARLGEVVRPVLIARSDSPVELGEVISTVVVERLMDGLLVGVLLVAVGLASGDLESASTIRSVGLGVGGIFTAIAIGVVVAARWSGWSIRLVHRLFGRWPTWASRLEGLIESFRSGLFTLLRSHRHALGYLALSVLMWTCSGLALLLIVTAFDLSLPLLAVFVVIGVQSVGILVPSAPTTIGTFHYAVMWALGLYGLAEEVLFNFALVFHLGQVCGNLLVGLAGMLLLRSAALSPSGRLEKQELSSE